MAYQVKLGMEGRLYINDGSYEVPTWTQMGNAKDVTINLEKGDADVTTRDNNGWRASVGTLKDGGIEFDALWLSKHLGFRRIKRAYFRGTPIEIAAMDGDISKPGVEGLRATVAVMNLSRAEPLEEGISASVSMKPTVSDHAPIWYETEEIATTEPTTAAGANLFYDATNEKATFTETGNAFIGRDRKIVL